LGLYILGIGPKISPFFAYSWSILVIEPKKKLQKKKRQKIWGGQNHPQWWFGSGFSHLLGSFGHPKFFVFF
jgi:hypothetical protein